MGVGVGVGVPVVVAAVAAVFVIIAAIIRCGYFCVVVVVVSLFL